MPVVIGGMVLDVLSTPSVSANPRSTTPGKVDFMLGGVARNIGECMAKLGTKCYMISAVGCDMAGVAISTVEICWTAYSRHSTIRAD